MRIIVDIVRKAIMFFPDLPRLLKVAHINKTPEEFMKNILRGSILLTILITVTSFFFFSVLEINLAFLLLVMPMTFFMLVKVFAHSPLLRIRKRQIELDKEVLFAGRFLQVKLLSGKPLLNALIEASKSYGVSSSYFKEIVDDITVGTPIEKALENAMNNSPSLRFKKILFQINNALKIGINVSIPLTNVLDEISKEQLLDIQKYSKKLNSLTMFYMMIAIVMPSLGAAIIAVAGSVTGLISDEPVARAVFLGICGALVVVQFIFILAYKNIRLMVNV